MKAKIAFVAGLAVALAVPVVAQTSGQFAQLVSYVGKIAARQLVLEQKVDAERVRGNALTVYLRDFTCKYNLTNVDLTRVSRATDAMPVQVTIVTGKNCFQSAAAPEIPPELP